MLDVIASIGKFVGGLGIPVVSQVAGIVGTVADAVAPKPQTQPAAPRPAPAPATGDSVTPAGVKPSIKVPVAAPPASFVSNTAQRATPVHFPSPFERDGTTHIRDHLRHNLFPNEFGAPHILTPEEEQMSDVMVNGSGTMTGARPLNKSGTVWMSADGRIYCRRRRRRKMVTMSDKEGLLFLKTLGMSAKDLAMIVAAGRR